MFVGFCRLYIQYYIYIIIYYNILYWYINSNSTDLFVRISAEYSLNATRQRWVLPCHPSIVDCPMSVRWSIISWGQQRPDALKGRCKNCLAGEPIRPGRPWVSFSDLSCCWGAPFSTDEEFFSLDVFRRLKGPLFGDGDVIWGSATCCWTRGYSCGILHCRTEDSLPLGSNLMVFQAWRGGFRLKMKKLLDHVQIWTQHVGEFFETFRVCFSACSDSSPPNTPYPLHAFDLTLFDCFDHKMEA